jgi:cobalt-precorrin 5A hydrolase
MECDAVRVAGFGFTSRATVASLRSALAAAGGGSGLTALAAPEDKVLAPLRALAVELGLPLRAVALGELDQPVLTRVPRQPARYGAGSVAEASALAAAGVGARLMGPRAVSDDRQATAAIAERNGE